MQTERFRQLCHNNSKFIIFLSCILFCMIPRTINLMSMHTYAALINASYGRVIVTCPVDSISSQSITTRSTGLKCGECHVKNNRLNENETVLSIMTLVGSFSSFQF